MRKGDGGKKEKKRDRDEKKEKEEKERKDEKKDEKEEKEKKDEKEGKKKDEKHPETVELRMLSAETLAHFPDGVAQIVAGYAATLPPLFAALETESHEFGEQTFPQLAARFPEVRFLQNLSPWFPSLAKTNLWSACVYGLQGEAKEFFVLAYIGVQRPACVYQINVRMTCNVPLVDNERLFCDAHTTGNPAQEKVDAKKRDLAFKAGQEKFYQAFLPAEKDALVYFVQAVQQIPLFLGEKSHVASWLDEG